MVLHRTAVSASRTAEHISQLMGYLNRQRRREWGGRAKVKGHEGSRGVTDRQIESIERKVKKV